MIIYGHILYIIIYVYIYLYINILLYEKFFLGLLRFLDILTYSNLF